MSDSAKSIISIIIGDWSQDGHGKSDSFRFECSHPEKDVQRAYLAFVKKYKLGLHDTENGGHTPMLCEYQENIVTKDQHDILVKAGVDFDAEFMDAETNDDGGLWFSPQSVAVLFMEMAKTQIPGFTYKLLEQEYINGYWKKGFNHSFGYGVYD